MQPLIKYAGIGSRETPGNILDTMQCIGRILSQKGFVLRSGHAKGADKAFEKGECFNRKEIFTADDAVGMDDWFEHTSKYHPAWDRCSPWAKALHARNSAIILGEYLDDPVEFVVCWTKDGKASGGTGQALRIAQDLEIPIFNLFFKEKGRELKEFIECKH